MPGESRLSTPDIFISYARPDAEAARRLAEGFAAEGLAVWWDNSLQAGEVFDEAIENALRSAKAVVVLWSPHSVASRWVRAEATLADRKKTLVPALIAPCERPIIFELTQTTDLCHWQGDASDKVWQTFLADVRAVVGRAPAKTPTVHGSTAPLPRLDQVSIVVLPFANMSGDPEQEYFADGISEDIITDLSKVSALSVISRNSSFTFKGKHVDLPDVARQLNVTHVLEGSVRKAGNRVRVTAQLIDGSSNDHLWAERYDRDLDDIFALQDELSQAIVAALKLKLLPQEKKAIEDRGTANVEAYDLFVRARSLLSTFEPASVQRAITLFREVTLLDPGFALAWANLVTAVHVFGVYDFKALQASREEMKHALEHAKQLAPDAPDVAGAELAVSAWAYNWVRIDELLRKSPGKLAGANSGHYELCLGRAQEAAEHQMEHMRADPLNVSVSFVLQYCLDPAGRLDEAEAEYRRSQDLRGNPVMTGWRGITRAMVHGDHARVRMLFADHFGDDTHFMPFRPQLLAVIDQPQQALEVLRQAQDDPSCEDAPRQMAIANWAIYFGDNDLAMAAVTRGLVEQKCNPAFIDLWQPNLAGLRQDPRFKDVLRAVGLVDFWRSSGNWGDFARPLGDDDFEMIG